MIKLRKKVTINKVREYYDIHEDLPGISIKVEKENSKIKLIELIGKGPKDCVPRLVTNDFLKSLNFQNPWSTVNGVFGWTNSEMDLNKVLSGKLEIKPENLIFINGRNHLLFKYDGTILNKVELFDCCNTPFHNRYSKLKPMLEHLKENLYIIHDETDPLVIKVVPYYNNESGKEKYIAGENSNIIKVLLPQEIIQEIYERAISDKTEKYYANRMKELMLGGFVYGWRDSHVKDLEKDYLEIKQFAKEKKPKWTGW